MPDQFNSPTLTPRQTPSQTLLPPTTSPPLPTTPLGVTVPPPPPPPGVPPQPPPQAPPANPPGTSPITITSDESEKTPGSLFPKVIFYFLAFLLLALTAGGGFLTFKYFFQNPQKILIKSLGSLAGATSLTANITTVEDEKIGNLSITWDYQKDSSQFSQISARLNKIGGDPFYKLALSAIYSQDEIFIRLSYSKLAEIETQIPQIASLQTYQSLKPVLTGDRFLHIKIPESKSAKTDKQPNLKLSEDQKKKLQEKLLKSIIIRSYNQNYEEGGQKYYRITLGFDKMGLISLVESLKELNLDLKLSDINSLTKIISSVDNWNSDLIEILVEKNSYNLHSLSLSLPDIPEETLSESVEGKIKENEKFGDFSKIFSQNIPQLFKKKGGNLNYLGKVVFTNYNAVPTVVRPTEVLEFEQVMVYAQQELLPLMQIFMGGLQTPQQGLTPLPIPTIQLPTQSSNQPLQPQPTIIFPPTTPAKFQSAGEKTVEEGVSAVVTNGWEEGESIKIKVTFINNTSTNKNIYVGRISLKSQTQGTINSENILSANFSPKEKRTFEFSYLKLPDPPYRFIYAPLDGSASIELGSYTP